MGEQAVVVVQVALAPEGGLDRFLTARSTETTAAPSQHGGGVDHMGMAEDGIRAADPTRSMRLLGDDLNSPAVSTLFGGQQRAAAYLGRMGSGLNGEDEHAPEALMNAFAADNTSRPAAAVATSGRGADGAGAFFDAREAVNRAAAVAVAESKRQDDSEIESGDDTEDEHEGVARPPRRRSPPVSGRAGVASRAATMQTAGPATSLADMFAPPVDLMHRAGGFQGARNVARDARRWLLVNLQRDSDFSCHALNRDVWRDELVENLVREGFIFWQAVS